MLIGVVSRYWEDRAICFIYIFLITHDKCWF